MTTAEQVLDGLADALRRRIVDRRQAEEQLAAFAFREHGGAAGVPMTAQGDWRYFVSRTLAAAGELGTLDLLERIATGHETVASLAVVHPAASGGGLIITDRIGGLSASGLVGRDLETGAVRLTALGSALLAFALELERRAGEVERPADRGDR